MMLEWKVTDDISCVTLEEFDSEWNGIYGFAKLNIFDKTLGYIPENVSTLEGNHNILYWMTNLAECGICILERKEYDAQLLSFNKLLICVKCDNIVCADLIHEDTLEVISHAELEIKDVLDEICANIMRFKEYVEIQNASFNHATLMRELD
ncbi:MAG: hypothetical protein K2I93_06620 [Oscillospiraceae bacterium]|nr:hypothetical protein [Oscillospiraceae bacterium]